MLKLSDRTLVVHLAQFAPKSIQQTLELRHNIQMGIQHLKSDLNESEMTLQTELGMHTPNKADVRSIKRIKRMAKGDVDVTPLVEKAVGKKGPRHAVSES